MFTTDRVVWTTERVVRRTDRVNVYNWLSNVYNWHSYARNQQSNAYNWQSDVVVRRTDTVNVYNWQSNVYIIDRVYVYNQERLQPTEYMYMCLQLTVLAGKYHEIFQLNFRDPQESKGCLKALAEIQAKSFP